MTRQGFRRWFRIDPGIPAYVVILFEVCLFIHLTSSLIGWDRELNDFHDFRQSQTAITAHYIVQDGFKLAYETPVLGKPWSIPMEFPLYQWLVAACVKTLGTPLIQTGRFLSLLFFYLTLIPLFHLLGSFFKGKDERFLILCLVLLSPPYLFWSRTFMIESLALFLSMGFLWAVSRALRDRKLDGPVLALGILAGSLAALVKVTTFLAFCFPALALLAWSIAGTRGGPGTSRNLLFPAALLFLLPLGLSKAWIAYADALKSANPLAADFLTSDALTRWNFGTLEQRLSPEVWNRIFEHSGALNLLGRIPVGGVDLPVTLLAGLLVLAWVPRRRIPLAASLAAFFLPLLVFTNLYYVHNYYFYANSLFLAVFFGLCLVSLMEGPWRAVAPLLRSALLPALLALAYMNYLSDFKVFGGNPDPTPLIIARTAEHHTAPTDVLLMYGFDWNPTIPFHAHRRALMDRRNLPLQDERIRTSLDNLGSDRIGAMLTAGAYPPRFIRERVEAFQLDPVPLVLGAYSLYKGRPASPGPRTTTPQGHKLPGSSPGR